MADGDLSLDASGNVILDASGNAYVACCCNPQKYVQARRCSDGADVDAWFPYDDAGATHHATVGGVTVALPAYLTKAGVKYYLADGNNLSPPNAVGTLGTGFATTTTCATCSQCLGSSAASYALTFTGITPYACASPAGFANSKLVGDVNGTYTVAVSSCAGAVAIPLAQAYEQTYTIGAACAAGQEVSQVQMSVRIALDTSVSGGTKVKVEGTGVAFSAAIPALSECRRSFTLGNELSGGTFGGQMVLATGGTVTVTAL
jgi:hypothetical protein